MRYDSDERPRIWAWIGVQRDRRGGRRDLSTGVKLLAHLIGEALAALDLWWARMFGRPLSGRINRLEIQTLFHGNTKDQDQI